MEELGGGPALRVKDLTFSYPSYPGLPAAELLRGCSFDLEEGERIVILGRPESGKSTLTRILVNVVPRFTGGTVAGNRELRGESLDGIAPYDLVTRLGVAFQNPDEQITTTRCAQEIAFPLESVGMARGEMRSRVTEALELTGIAHLADRDPSTLSGGEKRRLVIATLLASGAPVWILDEALEEIDEESRASVLRLLSERGTAAVMMSSKPPEIVRSIAGGLMATTRTP